MKSLEAIFVQTPEKEVYGKLQSALLEDLQESTKTIKCTKKAFTLFEARGKDLLAKKQLDNFQVLLATLREYAIPVSTYFKKFKGFGLAEMISMLSWLDILSSSPMPHPSLIKSIEELVNTIGVVAEYSEDMASSLMIFLPSLLKIGSDHYNPVTLRFEVIRVLNDLLKDCPVREKQRLKQQQAVRESLMHMGANLHNAGDFELQVCLLETLSRFTDIADRRVFGPSWFDRINLTDRYLAIREEEFDIDCRYFLNSLNKAFSFNQSVYSLPIETFKVGSLPLYKPSGIAEFWVDFNTLSKCLSVFTEDATASDDDRMWETVYIKKDEVKNWSIAREGNTGSWRISLLLKGPVPIPLKSTPTSDRVSIHLSSDPRAALTNSIGEDKELGCVKAAKSSIAVKPVRVSSSHMITEGQENSSCSVISPVTPDDRLENLMLQVSSQETVRSKGDSPVERASLPPKTPHTSTPKTNPSVKPSPPTKPSIVVKAKGTTPSLKGAINKKTPKLIKQPLSFTKSTVDSDFALPKRINLLEKLNGTQQSKRTTDSKGRNKRTKQTSTQANKTKSSNNSITSSELSYPTTSTEGLRTKKSCTKKLVDITFDFPDSPKKQPPSIARASKKRKKSAPTHNPLSSSSSGSGSKRSRIQAPSAVTTTTLPPKPSTKPLPPTSPIFNLSVENHTHIDETLIANELIPNKNLHVPIIRATPKVTITPSPSPQYSPQQHSTRNSSVAMDTPLLPAGDNIITDQSKHVKEAIEGSETSSTVSGGYGLAVDDILMEDRMEDGELGEEGEGDSIDRLSLSSFHSSQVEPDMRIVNEFEEDCQSVINSVIEVIPKSKAKEKFSIGERSKKFQIEEDLVSPPKKARATLTSLLTTPHSLTTPTSSYAAIKKRHSSTTRSPINKKSKQRHSSHRSTMRSPIIKNRCEDFYSIGSSSRDTTDSPSVTASSTTTTLDAGVNKENIGCNNRGFLVAFKEQLDRELIKGDDKLQKAEDNYMAALSSIEDMSAKTSSVNEIVSRMKQLHDTLFVNIDKMNQHNHGNVQKQCVSVMQEMKLQRQKMLKQAHDREVQRVRQTLQSLLVCLQL